MGGCRTWGDGLSGDRIGHVSEAGASWLAEGTVFALNLGRLVCYGSGHACRLNSHVSGEGR